MLKQMDGFAFPVVLSADVSNIEAFITEFLILDIDDPIILDINDPTFLDIDDPINLNIDDLIIQSDFFPICFSNRGPVSQQVWHDKDPSSNAKGTEHKA